MKMGNLGLVCTSCHESWTATYFSLGIVLFNSHLQTQLSSNALLPPPQFTGNMADIPSPVPQKPRTFRELYLDMLPSLNVAAAGDSPFYAFSPIFRLNCFCWRYLIAFIRDCDEKNGEISETAPINWVEEVRKCYDVLMRGGSIGWARSGSECEAEAKTMLDEDYTHVLKQAQFLWDTREKLAKAHERRAEARMSTLTNTFTFM
jgi:hypothetical protein